MEKLSNDYDLRIPIRFMDRGGKDNIDKYKCKPQYESFKPFIEKYPEICLQMDGILDYEKWTETNIHIMYFLKDSYRKGNYDRLWSYVIDNCKNMNAHGRTWSKILKWNNAIKTSFNINEDWKDISNISYINASKFAIFNSVYTRKGIVESSIRNDYRLLAQQIKEISPNIIICCGKDNGKWLYEYLFELFAKDKGIAIDEYKKSIIKEYRDIENRVTIFIMEKFIIFSVYHPSINKTKTDGFKNCIKNNMMDIKRILKI